MILLLTILTNAIEAIYEGLYDNGKRTVSGIIEMFQKLIGVTTVAYITYGLTVGMIAIPLWKIIIGFMLIRFLIFDYTYNKVRGLDFYYQGTTKLYDKALSSVPGHFILFAKVIAGMVGITFLLGIS